MKTETGHIGILGLGSRSTLFYLEILNQRYHGLRGDYHTFPCVVYNVDFNTINPYLPNQFDKLIPALEHHLKACSQLQIRACLIPNITLHETYDLGKLAYPIIHPMPLAMDFLKRKNIKKVTVFGSRYTMESHLSMSVPHSNHII